MTRRTRPTFSLTIASTPAHGHRTGFFHALRPLRVGLLLIPIATAAAQGPPPAPGPGDAIDTWNMAAVDAAATVARRTQTVSTIEVTMVQAAVYDAVTAIDGMRHQPYASAVEAPAWASVDAAVARAAHDVLTWLYPAQAATFDARLDASLAALPNDAARQAGLDVGAASARALIALRTGDGRDAPIDYTPRTGPGAWQPTPPAFLAAQTPWVAFVRPFTMTGPSQFRPGAPPALTSSAYTKAHEEVRAIGALSGSTRTAAETRQALFWADHLTVQSNRYLRALAGASRLAAPDKARLFASVNMAIADALIGCLDAKYAYGFWRPVTSIPAADEDGNPQTRSDATWLPLLTTPNHPEYPSAHACGSQAMTSTLAAFFGTDRVASTVESGVDGAGGPRTFARFSDLYDDVHESRILGGLHYRFSMDVGQRLGLKLARQLVRQHFRPVRQGQPVHPSAITNPHHSSSNAAAAASVAPVRAR